MGAIRLFLAFVVVIDHVRELVLRPLGLDTGDYIKIGMNAGHAVMFFYVISGFLISYVLQDKYPALPAEERLRPPEARPRSDDRARGPAGGPAAPAFCGLPGRGQPPVAEMMAAWIAYA